MKKARTYKPKKGATLVRCLMTGRMIPRQERGRLDMIDPKPLGSMAPDAKRNELARVADELADMRQQWAALESPQRAGETGARIMKRYRMVALQFWHLTGEQPPPVYADA